MCLIFEFAKLIHVKFKTESLIFRPFSSSLPKKRCPIELNLRAIFSPFLRRRLGPNLGSIQNRSLISCFHYFPTAQLQQRHIFHEVQFPRYASFHLSIVQFSNQWLSIFVFFTGAASILYLVIFVIIKSASWGINMSNETFETNLKLRSTFPVLTGMLSLSFFIHNIIISIMRSNKDQHRNVQTLFNSNKNKLRLAT